MRSVHAWEVVTYDKEIWGGHTVSYAIGMVAVTESGTGRGHQGIVIHRGSVFAMPADVQADALDICCSHSPLE